MSKRMIQEFEVKGFKVLTDYKNLNTPVSLQCKNGHTFSATLTEVRKDFFSCPHCVESVFTFSLDKVKNKKGYRWVGVDASTTSTGLALFEEGELIAHMCISAPMSWGLPQRLHEIRKKFVKYVCEEWQVDYVVLEEIHGSGPGYYSALKALAGLQGVLREACAAYKINQTAVMPSAWRKPYGISSGREAAKRQAIGKVKVLFGITVNDDVAEAILIGKYSTRHLEKHYVKMLF